MDDDANTMDANAFEMLLRHDTSTTVNPETDHSSSDLSMEQPPAPTHSAPLVIQTEPGDTSQNVVVKRFPHGRPGALVTSIPQGSSIYESTQDQLGCHGSDRDACPQGRPGVARPSDTSAKNIGGKECRESRRKHVDRSDGSGREY